MISARVGPVHAPVLPVPVTRLVAVPPASGTSARNGHPDPARPSGYGASTVDAARAHPNSRGSSALPLFAILSVAGGFFGEVLRGHVWSYLFPRTPGGAALAVGASIAFALLTLGPVLVYTWLTSVHGQEQVRPRLSLAHVGVLGPPLAILGVFLGSFGGQGLTPDTLMSGLYALPAVGLAAGSIRRSVANAARETSGQRPRSRNTPVNYCLSVSRVLLLLATAVSVILGNAYLASFFFLLSQGFRGYGLLMLIGILTAWFAVTMFRSLSIRTGAIAMTMTATSCVLVAAIVDDYRFNLGLQFFHPYNTLVVGWLFPFALVPALAAALGRRRSTSLKL